MSNNLSQYNVRRKLYPNGNIQYFIYELPISINYKVPNSLYTDKKESNSTSIESLKVSRKRSKEKIYDYARSVKWDYFLTLTLNPKCCDRFDYTSSCSIIIKFTKWLRYYNFKYVIVPEQHKKGGWHFHALVSNDNSKVYEKMLTESGHFSKGQPIYNIKSFKYGFTTATQIVDTERVSSYICKYVSKSFNVPKGKKRYWVSKNIPKVIEELYFTTDTDFIDSIRFNADYSKYIPNKYNTLEFYELHKENKIK